MNEGVKILLERMKTNPDEFEGATLSTKWGQIIRSYEDHLDLEDYEALKAELNKIQQQAFTQAVMRELLAPEEDDDMGKWFSAQKIGTPRGGATLSPSIPSITLEHNEHLRAHLDALHKVEVRKKPVLKKEHKTLFGKLFNYS
jgi:hypothetical protein